MTLCILSPEVKVKRFLQRIEREWEACKSSERVFLLPNSVIFAYSYPWAWVCSFSVCHVSFAPCDLPLTTLSCEHSCNETVYLDGK